MLPSPFIDTFKPRLGSSHFKSDSKEIIVFHASYVTPIDSVVKLRNKWADGTSATDTRPVLTIRKPGSFSTPVSNQEWFSRFARVLCLWDALGEEIARDEWRKAGISFPMPKKAGLKLLMEAALDLPVALPGNSTCKVIASRHNGSLGGRPRKGENAHDARLRRFHMVEKDIKPSEDGQNAVVVTYSTQPELPTNP